MSVLGGALRMGRGMANARMSETVTVGRFERKRVPGELDPQEVLVELFYEGRARVKFPTASANDKAPAGQQVTETKITVSLPSGTRIIPTSAVVVVNTSTVDDALAGRRFRIDGPGQSGQTTAHRYPVVEAS